ncbi:amidase [Rhodalgimonas zhirmunskyi]|uniref:Amidase n=1 Tax=Rhodalgimonas zhirmunskyi TaxID=2964767 RepID=A0AAJ1X4J8_9RHOB|nr:amidase [Rhodoalgimonas zhirmunskyi]MDQ2093591.1 amidase [Rhodoalgimonas zhirmunskyi]
MTVSTPTLDQIAELAEDMGMNLTEADLTSFQGLMGAYVEHYNIVEKMPDVVPEVTYPRTIGTRPSAEENPLNAWYYKSTVKGADTGKLAGKTVVLKDNVMLAGVPMMNGSSTLEGYIPDVDATIVTRMLDEGATIVGKAHCELFCLSGGSHTNATGPVHNPHKMGYSAGGSSSGSGALVANGEVDLAIGGDQGGSIRIPASFCGIVGMKGTHGLVPYTGVMPIEVYVDHTGPMTKTVADNALMMEVLAGPDGYDSRQIGCKTAKYTDALGKGVKGMKVGVVLEGFGHDNSMPEVDEKVKAAAEKLKELGATVEEVSIPMHTIGGAIWSPIGIEGLYQTMMQGDGYGVSRNDLYVTGLMDFHRSWRERADELSESLKLCMLFGAYADKYHGKRFYGKAVNLVTALRAAYDKALEEYDVLLMPTLPMTATPLPGPDASREEIIQRAFEMLANTAPFDISHHPAISVPCGMVDGLPVGLQLVGKLWDEATLYQVADAYEQSGDWTTY